jgi:hypothetical protein
MTLVTVIGRGHSGTRAISHTLYASGVFMGATLNRSGDLVPPQDMYEACRILARYVEWKGGLRWDFSKLHTMPIPDEFTQLIRAYLKSVLDEHDKTPDAVVGWKIPETTLVYPWIVRMFPDIKYVFWIRDPRDCILNRHITDDLRTFGINYPDIEAYPEAEKVRMQRAISWKYQYEMVRATPRPHNWLEVRFEDFVLRQDHTLARLQEYLGIPLGRIIVRPDAIERYKLDEGKHDFDFFAPELAHYGYVTA